MFHVNIICQIISKPGQEETFPCSTLWRLPVGGKKRQTAFKILTGDLSIKWHLDFEDASPKTLSTLSYFELELTTFGLQRFSALPRLRASTLLWHQSLKFSPILNCFLLYRCFSASKVKQNIHNVSSHPRKVESRATGHGCIFFKALVSGSFSSAEQLTGLWYRAVVQDEVERCSWRSTRCFCLNGSKH